jgi:hypothetical protein
LRTAGVGCIYLVHGTFVGDDVAGLLTVLGRLFPTARGVLGRAVKSLVDDLMDDCGNYPPSLAAEFERALNAGGGDPIPVRTFTWSGDNHHLGRADGAVRLIDELADVRLLPGRRILCWGHSHAGNAFALLTQLLADREAAAQFFRAARVFYRVPLVGAIDIPLWSRVEARLEREGNPIRPPLDLVTFGTPIRYGWNEAGCDKLLHFVHHRPQPGLPEDRAAMPKTIDEVWHAKGGDYVNHFGIAGTNTPPVPLEVRAWLADRRLGRLLQPEYSAFDLLERMRYGLRTPDAGETLLTDYGDLPGNAFTHLAGHAVYTRRQWLPFHAAEVARRLYT